MGCVKERRVTQQCVVLFLFLLDMSYRSVNEAHPKHVLLLCDPAQWRYN